MIMYVGTAVIEKDYEVTAEDENEARLIIIDESDREFPGADLYLVKEIEKIG